MGQERRRYAIVSRIFSQVSLYACELRWVKIVGLGKERSGSGKLFYHRVSVIAHLHNFFNDCLEFWTVVRARRRIFPRLHTI